MAPISGNISMRRVDPGQTVAAEWRSSPSSNLNPVKVRVGVPEAEIGKVHQGAAAEVSAPSLGGRCFTGKVAIIGVAAEPASRTYTVKILVPNPGPVLLAGMVAEARIFGPAKIQSLTIPAEAVVPDPQGAPTVFVYSPDRKRVYARRVEVGPPVGKEVEIRSGLRGDEQIVVAGQQKVREGSLVEIAGGGTMNPVRASLRYPQVTIALTIMLVVCGVYALLRMPRREDPKIHVREGIVAAFYPGASAAEVENEVTQKVEQRLFKIEGVRREKTYSTSMNGAMFINLNLEDNLQDTEKFWSKLRLDMAELKKTDLPDGVQGPVVDYDFGDTVAVLLAIHSDHYGYRELKDYAERIESAIRRIRAVSKVKRIGEQKEEIDVSSSLRPSVAVLRNAGAGHEGAGRPQHGALRRRRADRTRKTAHSDDGRI